MKKRVLAAIMAAAMMITVTGCGGKEASETKSEESTASTETSSSTEELACDYNPLDYVTLGEYKGVDVEISGEYSTDEDAFLAYVNKELAASSGYEEDPDATEVKEDSIVNLDYMGLRDGVAFDGGTAQDQTIDVAGNCSVDGGGYIDGFTSGLPGAKVGDTIDCDVKFPDDYGNADLAGAAVVFRFTINYICKPGMTYDALTDDYVKENLGADSVDAYLTSERERFEEEISSGKEDAVKDALIEKIVKNCTIKDYPEKVIEDRLAYYLESYKSYTSDGDVEKYVKENLGISLDEFKDELRQQIRSGMDSEMVFAAIADTEDLDPDPNGTYDTYIERCHSAVEYVYENAGTVTSK
ncbi:MAG: FKBP-type peptidyl-prolyl cis-trans isomerase [Lachnospiraceae bacterium]|nr:FKBP-type peptidyl-prolyl cis-trans isomerase [Lachnospiraceae bacterium]